MKETTLSERSILRRSLIAFTVFILAFALGILAWKKLRHEPQDDKIPVTLRKGLKTNEAVFGSLFSKDKLAPSIPRSKAQSPRFNGDLGLKDPNFKKEDWRLHVVRAGGDTLSLSMDDIKALPKIDVVFEFKCIEGWSRRTWWSGVRFSDFARAYHLDRETALPYVGLSTPDNGYYVGIDMPSILQPQTILCYEQNGQPLSMNEGAPLRLIIPVKYGIKHLKRIGTVYFSNTPPPDYWAEQGYDYYAGH